MRSDFSLKHINIFFSDQPTNIQCSQQNVSSIDDAHFPPGGCGCSDVIHNKHDMILKTSYTM